MFNTGNCASVPLVANIDGNGNNGWGGDGGWLWIIVVFALLFGWGNGGFGGWGGNNGGGYVATAATRADIQRGFDNQAVISKLDGITNGLCDGFYAVNNSMLTGFNGINTNIMQTGYGIQQAINADTIANMQNANALQAQLANCCCETREAIQNVNYNMATNTCALQNTIVAAGEDVALTETPVCGSKCIVHRQGSGIVKLRGITNQCRARFLVSFSGNIQIPTGGTVEAISLALAVDGEPLQSTRMIVTPAAVSNMFNVSAQAYVDVPCGC